MITFEVNDMTCGHCASTITKAVKGQDKDARVQIDLAMHRVAIESKTGDARELSDAITDAGYTPVVVATPVERAAATMTAGGGCGCGCG
jgi:copper chaperone